MIQIPLGRWSSSCRNYPQEITPHLICKASIVCCKHFRPAGRTLCSSLDVRDHHSQVGFAVSSPYFVSRTTCTGVSTRLRSHSSLKSGRLHQSSYQLAWVKLRTLQQVQRSSWIYLFPCIPADSRVLFTLNILPISLNPTNLPAITWCIGRSFDAKYCLHMHSLAMNLPKTELKSLCGCPKKQIEVFL